MPPRKFRYSERAGDYHIAGNRGRFVSRREIRQALDGAIERSRRDVDALMGQLQRGEIGVAEWQLAMTREIRSATIAGLASAHGGFDQLTPAMYGRAGAHLKQQYAYLRRFAEEIERTGVVDGRAMRRAQMYIEAARQHHEREVGQDRRRRGFDLVKSVRVARDSCTASEGRDGCIEQERKGYQDPDDYVYPGERTCRSSCKCFSLWKNSQTGKVAA